jgi:uncharacterized protein (TIGR02246 family)
MTLKETQNEVPRKGHLGDTCTRHAMAPDEREIRTVHSIWIDAVNAGDLARLLTLVAEDVVFLTPGRAPFGREAFSSYFRTAHQQMRICCTSELEEVMVVGEVAYTRSRDALSVTPRAGGKAAQFAGHRMTVYRKQRDGRWLLSRDVHTLSAEEESVLTIDTAGACG